MLRRRSPLNQVRRSMYTMARLTGDNQVISSGNSNRIAWRGRNCMIGKALGRAGFWRWLWR